MLMAPRPTALLVAAIWIIIAGCSGETTQQKLALAEQHITEQHFATAIVQLKGILQEEPENLKAHRLIGIAYHQAGLYGEASQKLQRVIKSGINDETTVLAYSEALIKQGEYQLALDTLETNRGSKAQSEDYTALTAEAVLGLEKPGAAETIINDALANKPDSARLMLALSKVYLAQGKRFLSISQARKAIALQPYNHQLYEHLGAILFDEKMFDEAIDSFQSALEITPQGSTVQAIIATELKLLRAHMANNDAASAEQVLQTVKQRSPDHPAIDYFSAVLYLNENRLSEALVSAQKTLSKVDRHPPTELLVGVISYRLNKLEQANVYLERFLSSEPDRVVARKLLASTQLKLNNPEAAEQTLRSGMKGTPDDLPLSELITEIRAVSKPSADPILGGLVTEEANQLQLQAMIEKLENREFSELAEQIRSIKVLAEQGNLDEAYKKTTRLIAAYPDRGEIYEFAGAIAVLAQRPLDAEAFWVESLRLLPNNSSSALNLTNHYHRQHGPDTTATLLKKLLTDLPGSIGVLTGLAFNAEQRGDVDLSQHYLEDAVEFHPQLIEPRKALIQLLRRHNRDKLATQALEEALAAIPHAAELKVLLAQQLIVDGAIEQAIEILEVLLESAPDNIDMLLSYSIAWSKLGQSEQALDPLRKAYRLNPGSFKIASRLALLIAEHHGADAGLELIDDYRQTTEDQFGAEVITAQMWDQLGNYEQAANHYGLARQLNPGEQLLLMEVAATSKSGNTGRAIELSEGWLNEFPTHKKTRFELATLQLFSNRYIDSAKHYQQLLDEGGHLPSVYNNLAWLYQQISDDRAEEVARIGHQRYPDDPLLKDTYGWILVEANHSRGLAEQLLTEAYAETEIPDIGYHLAVALNLNNRPERAMTLLIKILAGGSEFETKTRAQALLNRLRQAN